MTDIDLLWQQLESAPAEGPGIVRRRLVEESGRDLYAAVRVPTGERMLILEIPGSVLPSDPLPSTSAIHTEVEPVMHDRLELRVSLVAPEMVRVFTPFMEDVVATVSGTSTDAEAVAALLDRFGHWRRLLSGGGDRGMTREEQQGLYSELWVFRHVLVPSVGPGRAVKSWQGPEHGYRDFVVSGIGIEVKSTVGSSPPQVVILDERQLDPAPFSALYLAALALDSVRDGAGETLNAMVDASAGLMAGSEAVADFRTRLLDYGYLDAQKALYEGMHYTLRSADVFTVTGDFPRIVEADLRPGVSQVGYRVTLSTCQPWKSSMEDLRAELTRAAAEGLTG